VTRVATGRTFQAKVMGDTASNGTGTYASACYLAVSANTTAVVDGDTALTGEVTTGTLARAQALFAYTAGASSYTLSKTFTSDQTIVLGKLGVFQVVTPATGNAVFLTLISPTASLISGDQCALTETVNL
jgi:hypothetical protein